MLELYVASLVNGSYMCCGQPVKEFVTFCDITFHLQNDTCVCVLYSVNVLLRL